MNSSSISYPVDPLQTTTARLYRYLGTSEYILANIGNIFITLIFTQKAWRKNVCVFYLLVCLLLDSLNINCALLRVILANGFNIRFTDSNVILCKLFSYLLYFLPTLSATVLVLASIDRLLISSQNVDTRLYSSKRLAYFSISTSSVFWFIFFFHILIKFDIQRIGLVTSICSYNLLEFYADFFSYSMLIINLILFLFMIILSILSFKNVHQISIIPRRQRQNVRVMRKKDFQLLRCLFARIIMYIMSNALYCIYGIYRIQKNPGQTAWEQEFLTFIANLGPLIHDLQFTANFFIYCTISKAFRKELKRPIWKMFGKALAPMCEEEQNEQEIRNDTQELDVVVTISK